MDVCPREDCCSVPLPGHRPTPWEFIDRAARALGLAAVGVAGAARIPDEAARAYDAWIAAGRHAGLAYAERHRGARLDPRGREIVDGATAIVCAALPYGLGATRDGLWRFVAAHARGRDYHVTMRAKLTRLAEEICARFPGARCRAFVDTAPIPERTWAARAGVGEIGANGALSVPGVGPRVVLGEIVCAGVPAPAHGAEIAHVDPCRGCGACLAACPTGALVAPRTIDCGRCLSYHTIENARGEIPPDVARAAKLVFGCDACVAACPREEPRSATCGLDPPPSPCPDTVDLPGVAAMEEGALVRLIAGTCLERTGPAAIRRNARMVLSHGRASGIA
jgi:epoxyqueuosine reductase